MAADLTAPGAAEDVASAVDAIVGGALAVLVANVGGGLMGPLPYWQYSRQQEAATRLLNGPAAYELVRLLLPRMVDADRGAVVVVSSLLHKLGGFAAPYASEKAGLNALCAALDTELALAGSRVTVQAMVLGPVDTPNIRRLMAAGQAQRGGGVAKTSGEGGARPSADAVAAAMLAAVGRGGPLVTPHWRHALMEAMLLDAVWPPALQRAVKRSVQRCAFAESGRRRMHGAQLHVREDAHTVLLLSCLAGSSRRSLRGRDVDTW